MIKFNEDSKSILQALCTAHSEELTFSECKEYLEELDSCIDEDDFSFDFEGMEFRIISDSEIWEIYIEEIKHLVEECYDLSLDNMPDFVAFNIDWEQTATNTKVDGYGHTFSGYDGSELNADSGHWIFRTN